MIDLEVQYAPVGSSHRLSCQVNMQGVSFGGLNFFEKFLNSGLVQRYGQDAIIKAIIIEDICKAGSDDTTETIIVNGPGRVFS